MPYDALLTGRCSRQHQIYAITTVTRDRTPFFSDLIAARLLILEIRRLHDSGDVHSLAWVVMPDHLHWLIQLNEHWPLSTVVKTLKARSAVVINRYLRRRGSIWQRAFYDRALRTNENIRQTARYIVANPLRAGLVRRVGDYPHWDCVWMVNGIEEVLVE